MLGVKVLRDWCPQPVVLLMTSHPCKMLFLTDSLLFLMDSQIPWVKMLCNATDKKKRLFAYIPLQGPCD